MELLQSILTEWNKNTNERAKLQQAYVAIVITGVVVAGIITLLNPNLGHTIIVFTGFLFVAMVANAVVWALLKTFVVDRLKQRRSK